MFRFLRRHRFGIWQCQKYIVIICCYLLLLLLLLVSVKSRWEETTTLTYRCASPPIHVSSPQTAGKQRPSSLLRTASPIMQCGTITQAQIVPCRSRCCLEAIVKCSSLVRGLPDVGRWRRLHPPACFTC